MAKRLVVLTQVHQAILQCVPSRPFATEATEIWHVITDQLSAATSRRLLDGQTMFNKAALMHSNRNHSRHSNWPCKLYLLVHTIVYSSPTPSHYFPTLPSFVVWEACL